MPCLGGTHQDPKAWVRLTPDGDLEQAGRVEGCQVEGRDTRRKLCHGCPAFRGRDREGVMQTGIAPNGEPYALSLREYELWQEDPEDFWAWKEGGARWGWRTEEGEAIKREYQRDYMRDYMKAYRQRPEYRERQRAKSRERMRRLRERRRYAKTPSLAREGLV